MIQKNYFQENPAPEKSHEVFDHIERSFRVLSTFSFFSRNDRQAPNEALITAVKGQEMYKERNVVNTVYISIMNNTMAYYVFHNNKYNTICPQILI